MRTLFIIGMLTVPVWSQVLYPIQDSYVTQDEPANNFGTVGYLEVSSNTFNWNTIGRSLMQFDLTSIVPGTGIQSAFLSLYMFNQAGTDFEVEIRRVLDPWDEMTVTWNNQPIHDTDFTAVLPYQNYGWWHFDVTNLVQFWVDNPTMNHGLMLKVAIEQYPDSLGRLAWFYSRDTSLNQPYLDVTQVGALETEMHILHEWTLAPNPARGSVAVRLSFARETLVQLALYDVLGRERKTIYNGIVPKGHQTFMIDTRDCSPGTFFVMVEAGSFKDVQPLVIVK